MYIGYKIPSVHARTGKCILQLDFLDAPDGAAWVVHPETGNQIRALDLDILGEAFEVEESDTEVHFTSQQLRSYSAKLEEDAARPVRANVQENDLGRFADSWSVARLTFFRTRIEALAPGDRFAIEVAQTGLVYAMTREDFEAHFANVVSSRSYREYGNYNYREVPSHADRFVIRPRG